jgi:tRNA (cytidine32/uridine32-2'-O)-methyltransferase
MRTTHPGNIGAVARAMKNMGLSRLTLVQPKTFPSEEALARAAGAEEILVQARICETLDEAVAEDHITVGASARSRSLPWPMLNPRVLAQTMIERIDQVGRAAELHLSLVFGQEASGLSNDELQRCNYHVHIPSVESFSSLNLAMAVQVLCYELRMAVLERTDVDAASQVLVDGQHWDQPLASQREVGGMLEHLREVMSATGFSDPEHSSALMPRLRRLFLRSHLDRMEVNILRGILNAVQKKLS